MFDKRFEIGLADCDIDKLNDHAQYINSYFIGLSAIDECRENFIPLYKLRTLIEKATKQDAKIWVTCNNLNIPNALIKRKTETLMDLYSEYKFHGFIIADINIAEGVRKWKVPVSISTVCDIQNMNDVSRYVELGYTNIVLSYKVTRNFDFLKECCTTYPNVTFTIIVNELCESNCPYRTGHFLRVACGEQNKFDCIVTDYANNINSYKWKLRVLQSTLLMPENLQYLDEELPNIIFKLATRHESISTTGILKYIDRYIGNKEWDNMLKFVSHQFDKSRADIMKPCDDLVKRWQNCKHQCHKCNMCQKEIFRMAGKL